MFSMIKALFKPQMSSDDFVFEIRRLLDKASEYQESAQYNNAESLFKQALHLSEQAFGPDSLQTSVI